MRTSLVEGRRKKVSRRYVHSTPGITTAGNYTRAAWRRRGGGCQGKTPDFCEVPASAPKKPLIGTRPRVSRIRPAGSIVWQFHTYPPPWSGLHFAPMWSHACAAALVRLRRPEEPGGLGSADYGHAWKGGGPVNLSDYVWTEVASS